MKFFGMGVVVGILGLLAADVRACPSGQTCPAGSDCVANPNLCVADTSTGSTSTEPTTTKDQLGLVLEPSDALKRVFSFDDKTGTWLFYDTQPEFKNVNTLTQADKGKTCRVKVNQPATLKNNLQNAPIPLLEGWNLIRR